MPTEVGIHVCLANVVKDVDAGPSPGMTVTVDGSIIPLAGTSTSSIAAKQCSDDRITIQMLCLQVRASWIGEAIHRVRRRHIQARFGHVAPHRLRVAFLRRTVAAGPAGD